MTLILLLLLILYSKITGSLSALQISSKIVSINAKIAAERWVRPGDYIIHKQLGVGKYKGSIIYPSEIDEQDGDEVQRRNIKVHSLVVQFEDGETFWLPSLAQKVLYLRQSSILDMELKLDSISNTKNHEKRMEKSREKAKR
jgi:transcription-repair coupling factor (superfamily II helicase)